MANFSVEDNNISNLSIKAHQTKVAVVLKYDLLSANESNKNCQKLLFLKELNENADTALIAQIICEKCPIIGPNQISELEQVIYYLQKRLSLSKDHSKQLQFSKAKMENMEMYMEMLYEDSDKLTAVTHLHELSLDFSNLNTLIENEALMGALTRLYREDSKKNFVLATNIAKIFYQFSCFSQFHSTLSHFKIGGFTMQLIDEELKRLDIWLSQQAEEKSNQKLNVAVQKQSLLLTICFQILLNFADDIKVEYKMVKRGILFSLMKCLSNTSNASLLIVIIKFLWKLSVFNENRLTMDSLKLVEKCVPLFQINSPEMPNLLFTLFFNLSFDSNLRKQMINAGLINILASNIKNNFVALNLLYQLSISEEAKSLIKFTDLINLCMNMLFDENFIDQSLTVKAFLINIAMEKQNAIKICEVNDNGLDSIMSYAFENVDHLMLKLAHNISLHGGLILNMFLKWVPQLMENALSKIEFQTINKNQNDGNSNDHLFGLECVKICVNITSADWQQVDNNLNVVKFMNSIIQKSFDKNNKTNLPIKDDVLLQIVELYGTFSQQYDMAEKIYKIFPDLLFLLNKKKEDDEFVLQILYLFLCLFSHQKISVLLCSDDSQLIEYLIKLMHDKNHKIRTICDQILQIVMETNKNWNNRIMEERFCWHNMNWIEMITQNENISDNIDSLDNLNGLILDADDILEI